MASERAILHCDMNSFYASCEAACNPKLQGKPIAVCGDPERRNGIVLTASYPAKWMGVKTGMPLWEAQQHCRDIIFVPAHYDLYTCLLYTSRRAKPQQRKLPDRLQDR